MGIVDINTLFLGIKPTYLVKDHSDVLTKYSEVGVIRMLDFLIDDIYVEFSGLIFQQTVGIPMGTNCAKRPGTVWFCDEYALESSHHPRNPYESYHRFAPYIQLNRGKSGLRIIIIFF